MKQVVFAILFIMAIFITGTSSANVPNTNYDEAGKGAIGISLSRLDSKANVPDYGIFDFDHKWNFGAKAEVVVAPKWAVGFNYIGSKSDDSYLARINSNAEASLKTFELTMQYMAYQKDGFSLMPYIGWARDKARVKGVVLEYNLSFAESANSDDFLLGTKMVYDFNKQFSAYADLGFGNDILKWGIGVGYKLTPELTLSLGYEYRKADGFVVNHPFRNESYDLKAQAKNITLGLTYLF